MGPSAGDLAPAFATAVFIAIASAAMWARIPQQFVSLIRAFSAYVPAVSRISSYLVPPDKGFVILGLQWLFVPWYVWVFFYRWAPRSTVMRESIATLAEKMSVRQRAFIVVAIVVLGVLLSGSLGLVSAPTFYNGLGAFPPADTIPVLKPIYTSTVALAIYATLSPLTETCMWWALCVLVANFRTYVIAAR
jgi:hypothetical protein